MIEYWSKVHLMGLKSSPAVANTGVRFAVRDQPPRNGSAWITEDDLLDPLHLNASRSQDPIEQGCGVGSGVGVGGGGGANILLEAESESKAMKYFELKSESKMEAIKLLIFQYSILVSSDSTLIVVKGVSIRSNILTP